MPIETRNTFSLCQDVLDRNLITYNKHGTEIWKQVMRDLPSPYPELAERLYIAENWSDFFNLSYYYLLEEESANLLTTDSGGI